MDAAEGAQRLADKGWSRGWLMGRRDICRATDERTVIAAVVGRVGHTMPLFMTAQEPRPAAVLLANFKVLALDFIARVKVGQTNLTHGCLKQFPILPPTAAPKPTSPSSSRACANSPTPPTTSPPGRKTFGYDGPHYAFDPDRRAMLRAELDACCARLYGLTRDELRHLLDPADVMGEDYPSKTLRVLQKNEMREFGECRTRRLVLAAWDAQQQTGVSASC